MCAERDLAGAGSCVRVRELAASLYDEKRSFLMRVANYHAPRPADAEEALQVGRLAAAPASRGAGFGVRECGAGGAPCKPLTGLLAALASGSGSGSASSRAGAASVQSQPTNGGKHGKHRDHRAARRQALRARPLRAGGRRARPGRAASRGVVRITDRPLGRPVGPTWSRRGSPRWGSWRRLSPTTRPRRAARRPSDAGEAIDPASRSAAGAS